MVNYVSKFSNNNVEYIIKDSTARSDISSLQTSKANDDAVVKLTGAQTVAGVKTFSSRLEATGTAIVNRRNDITKGTNPESTYYWNYYMSDKNGTGDANAIGRVVTSVTSNGTVQTSIYAYKNATGSSSEKIAIYYPTSGDPFTYAPTPVTSDNSTKIATTSYVNARVQLVSTLPASPISGVLYCIPES